MFHGNLILVLQQPICSYRISVEEAQFTTRTLDYHLVLKPDGEWEKQVMQTSVILLIRALDSALGFSGLLGGETGLEGEIRPMFDSTALANANRVVPHPGTEAPADIFVDTELVVQA